MIFRNTADVYRNIFLFTAIPFGLSMGIFAGMFGGALYGLVSGVLAGLFYGGMMSLTVGATHQFFNKRLKADYSERLLGVHQVQVVTLEQEFDEAFTACRECLLRLSKCQIIQENKELGVIKAKTATSWKSFGEKILLTVSYADNQCTVTISSKPALETTIIDYGKNAENVRSIISALRENSSVIGCKIEPTSVLGIALEGDDGEGIVQSSENITLNIKEHEKDGI